MAKLTLQTVANLRNEATGLEAINDNSDLVEAAIENTLSRDGTAPNEMEANLDMNSFRILNLPAPLTDNEPARLIDITGLSGGGGSGLTIGTSTITGGVSGRLLFNNAGILGETTTPTLTGLTIAQGTITDPALNLSSTVTWNDAADTFTAWKLDVTNTNSAAASLLMDLQVGGSSKFFARKDGAIALAGASVADGVNYWAPVDGLLNFAYGGNNTFQAYQNVQVALASTMAFGWCSGQATGTPDLALVRDAANTLAQRNGTNAQAFNLYNTYTGATNYEKLSLYWSGNFAFIEATVGGGGGTLRDLCIRVGSSKSIFYDADTHSFRSGGGGAGRWIINSSGHFLTSDDNTYDIGASGATRPRSIYAGTNFVGKFYLGTGGGEAAKITLDTAGDGGHIYFGKDGIAARWQINGSTGHILAVADNSYDIGASGATRPRTGYFGTSLVSPVLTLAQGTITDPAPMLSGTVTWNDAADTFTAWRLNVTNTNSDAASLLIDLQVGGTTMFNVVRDGKLRLGAVGYSAATPAFSMTGQTGTGISWSGNGLFFSTSGSSRFSVNDAGMALSSDRILGWATGAADAGPADTAMGRNAAGIVEVNNGTLGTFRDLKARKLCTPMTGELTIAAGVITITGGYHNIDTEADAASDDLDTINGGADGDRLVIRANNAGRTVVVKDGTGNIQCAGDFSLDNTQDTMELIYDGTLTAWLEVGRSDSGV